MIDNLKKILNEDQDPKAIEKISEKLTNILMRNEEVGYIAVQKNPVLTVFPDSIVVTNKRILILKPKNLGLSLEVLDFDWEDIVSPFIKEGILGAEFSFITKNDITTTLDKLPKNQARKLFTFAKEQLQELKENKTQQSIQNTEEVPVVENVDTTTESLDDTLDFKFYVDQAQPVIEEIYVEEPIAVTQVVEATIIPDFEINNQPKPLAHMSKEELFDKLQNYKKLLDNGLILQGEYDRLKAEILNYL